MTTKSTRRDPSARLGCTGWSLPPLPAGLCRGSLSPGGFPSAAARSLLCCPQAQPPGEPWCGQDTLSGAGRAQGGPDTRLGECCTRCGIYRDQL